ncbi:ABC transporter permease [Microbacterium sp. STN6]|uniref:ABC transporter permease n=1 Tax=Microbacterium sp. STN6 TaxID=2995588 RepID=UPI002260F754|nr:ABC transporter permease [Microbacterium sp. STN6]MCX7521436.1 ABC transporter permease [Microbacterium sp. STN6]
MRADMAAARVRRVAGAIGLRLGGAVLVVWGAATLAFLAIYLTPGDPAYAVVGGTDANPSPAVLAQIRAEYGFDQPWYVQYGSYLWRLAHGDLGTSYRLREPVATAIGQQLGGTVQLALAAGLLAVVLAIVVALLTAHRRPWIRGVSSSADLVLASMPSFWLGILLLSAFSYGLHLLPAIGNRGWQSLVLPAVTLALPLAAVLTQVLRNALEEVLEEPFITSARARGLSDTAVRLRHAMRHALIPLATMTGYLLGGLLGGTVVTETLFSRQGLGRLLLTAVNGKDLPVVIAIVVLSAVVYMVVNLAIDLVYPLIDPRLRRLA